MTEKSCERCRFWQRRVVQKNNEKVDLNRGRCNMFLKSPGQKKPPMYSDSPIYTEPTFYCAGFQTRTVATQPQVEHLGETPIDQAAGGGNDPAFYRRGQKPH